MNKLLKCLYKFFCCKCVSCILWEGIQSGDITAENFEEKKNEIIKKNSY